EINTTNNISNQVMNSLSRLNLNTAKKAFDEDKKTNEKTSQNPLELEVEPEKPKTTQPLKPSIDVEDIQKYANYMGENLSIDDINYALTYGRSVIADYMA
ncbi:hypothetical protein IJ670_08390, partial [bacterium]|nr:hypothetical protein [bacterium]